MVIVFVQSTNGKVFDFFSIFDLQIPAPFSPFIKGRCKRDFIKSIPAPFRPRPFPPFSNSSYCFPLANSSPGLPPFQIPLMVFPLCKRGIKGDFIKYFSISSNPSQPLFVFLVFPLCKRGSRGISKISPSPSLPSSFSPFVKGGLRGISLSIFRFHQIHPSPSLPSSFSPFVKGGSRGISEISPSPSFIKRGVMRGNFIKREILWKKFIKVRCLKNL
ncbi:MAG TPA: hypothetical protein PK165_07110 [bacterium]|nr:hypothetical protein [bacterium]